jgi:lycopene cyclase domain-containing protein
VGPTARPEFVEGASVGQAGAVPDVLQPYAYLGVLAFILLTTLPLELYLGVRVWRRPRRLALTVLPVVVVFTLWDLYAISRDHWFFDPEQTTGVLLFGILPLEELLFFVVVPIAGVMTLEAVSVVRRWPAVQETT